MEIQLNLSILYIINLGRDRFPKFENGLSIKKYEWPSSSFAKMILSLRDNFVKKTAWSLVYFMNNAYFET